MHSQGKQKSDVANFESLLMHSQKSLLNILACEGSVGWLDSGLWEHLEGCGMHTALVLDPNVV